MSHPGRTTILISLLAALVGAAGCPTSAGSFDGGVVVEPPPPTGPVITADQIGTRCTYDYASPGNPTNTCATGLSCLIYTGDGAYIPFPPGGVQNFTKSVWEDHFTRYLQTQPVDEGYCTLIGSWQAPPSCPFGTTLKLLDTNLAVCVKDCQTAADCGRTGYVCDARFLDVAGGSCVRACQLDVPDCVRSGHVSFPGQNGQPSAPVFVVAADDLAGASVCDLTSGMCAANPSTGQQAPGAPCATSRDCLPGASCVQGDVLRALDPGLPAGTTGFCAQPCKPDPQQPLSGGCSPGFACQAGFTFGHGNAVDPNPANGFVVVSLQDNGAAAVAGGFCFADCEVNRDCNAYPGTQCGAARENMFQYAWNRRSMCLIDPLRQ